MKISLLLLFLMIPLGSAYSITSFPNNAIYRINTTGITTNFWSDIRVFLNSSDIDFSQLRSDCRNIGFYDVYNNSLDAMITHCNGTEVEYWVKFYVNTTNTNYSQLGVYYGDTSIVTNWTNIFTTPEINASIVYIFNETKGSTEPVNWGNKGVMHNVLHNFNLTGYSLDAGNFTSRAWMEGTTQVTMGNVRTYSIVMHAYNDYFNASSGLLGAVDLIGQANWGFAFGYNQPLSNGNIQNHVQMDNSGSIACDQYWQPYNILTTPKAVTAFFASYDGSALNSNSYNNQINFTLNGVSNTSSQIASCTGTFQPNTDYFNVGIRSDNPNQGNSNHFSFGEIYRVFISENVKSKDYSIIQYRNYDGQLLIPLSSSHASPNTVIPDMVGTNNLFVIGNRTNATYQNFEDGYLISNDSIFFDRMTPQGFSISLWYEEDRFAPDSNIFLFQPIDNANYMDAVFSKDSNSFLFESSDGTQYHSLNIPNNHFLNDSRFHNIVISKNGFNYSLYVDSVIRDSGIWNDFTSNITSLFPIGFDSQYQSYGFLKQFAIYNQSLNETQIEQIFSKGENGITVSDGLIHYWVLTNLGTPLLRINSPLAQIYTNATIIVNITSDSSNVTFNVNGTNQTYVSPFSAFFNDGSYTMQAWAKNENGTSSSSVSFTVNTASPSPPTVTHGELYNSMNEAGAGLGVLINYLSISLFPLLMILFLVIFIIGVSIAIKDIIKIYSELTSSHKS